MITLKLECQQCDNEFDFDYDGTEDELISDVESNGGDGPVCSMCVTSITPISSDEHREFVRQAHLNGGVAELSKLYREGAINRKKLNLFVDEARQYLTPKEHQVFSVQVRNAIRAR